MYFRAMSRRSTISCAALLVGALGLGGCDTARFAAESSSGLFDRAGPAIEQYWDYETVGKAMPANIIQLEGILRIVPDNEAVLIAAMAAYIGYGYGWIEDRIEVADANDDYSEGEHLRKRARIMYERAWDLGTHLLRLKAAGFDQAFAQGPEGLKEWLEGNFTRTEDAKALLWVGQALGLRIVMNMEDMDAIADLPMAKVLVRHSVSLDPNFLFMSGKMLLAVMAASEFPPNLDAAEEMFDEILKGTERRNLMIQVNMARYYAVNLGDHQLFTALLEEVLDAGDVLPEARLSNRIARRRAQRYLDRIEYFFSDLSD